MRAETRAPSAAPPALAEAGRQRDGGQAASAARRYSVVTTVTRVGSSNDKSLANTVTSPTRTPASG